MAKIRIQGFFPVATDKVLEASAPSDIFLSPSVYRHAVRELDLQNLHLMEDVEKFMSGAGWDFEDVVAVSDVSGVIPIPFYIRKDKVQKLKTLLAQHNRYNLVL